MSHRAALAWLIAVLSLLLGAPAAAHPAPFSYLNLDIADGIIVGTVTVHVIDAARELGISDPNALLDPGVLAQQRPQLQAMLAPRLGLQEALPIEWTAATTMANDDAVRLSFRAGPAPAGALRFDPELFAYDPQHQTFVNVSEDGALRQQFIFARGSEPRTYYRGTSAGMAEVIRTFVPAGAHHIWIGADHLLFLLGLLLLGGGWRRLAVIVTAFTLGHSVTLSLAVLGIVDVPSSLVEPAIALSIVVVGVDNLLQRDKPGRDLRPLTALVFGLIHGFGFAGVLRELGLPQEALGWSIFSFNVGVELGQLAVAIPVVIALAMLRRTRPQASRRVELIGSVAVVAGGVYWFVERVFFGG